MTKHYEPVFNFDVKHLLWRNKILNKEEITGKMMRNAAYYSLGKHLGFKGARNLARFTNPVQAFVKAVYNFDGLIEPELTCRVFWEHFNTYNLDSHFDVMFFATHCQQLIHLASEPITNVQADLIAEMPDLGENKGLE